MLLISRTRVGRQFYRPVGHERWCHVRMVLRQLQFDAIPYGPVFIWCYTAPYRLVLIWRYTLRTRIPILRLSQQYCGVWWYTLRTRMRLAIHLTTREVVPPLYSFGDTPYFETAILSCLAQFRHDTIGGAMFVWLGAS